MSKEKEQGFINAAVSEEITRAAEYIKNIRDSLVSTEILTDIHSQNGKISARVKIEQCFYDSTVVSIVADSKAGGEHLYKINGYPVTEFHSILSIISPLLPRVTFLAKNPHCMTPAIADDIVRDLRYCERILTVRDVLTNAEITPDWNDALDPPLPQGYFVSLFPFRDSLYLSVYTVERTEEPLREMHVKASPFNFSPGSVVEIAGAHYSIAHSMVASQSLQFLVQIIRWLRSAIEDLETLVVLKPKK